MNVKNFFLTYLSRKFFLSLLAVLISGLALSFCAPQDHSADHPENTPEQDRSSHIDHSDSHQEEHGPKEPFNAGKLIMEHISDSHEWHLWGDHDNAVSIPLPIIAHTPEEGFKVFLSSKFHHGKDDYQGLRMVGKYIYRVNNGEFIDDKGSSVPADADGRPALAEGQSLAPLKDFSITKNAVSIIFASLLILFLFIRVGNTYKKRSGLAPKGLQNAVETVVCFIRDEVARPSVGEKNYERFMPFLLTIFFFIWINNVLGLVPFFPGGANTTGNIAIPLVLATCVFVVVNLNGKKSYWRHTFAMPGIPIPILLILTPIEILQIFIRPIVLMIRLFANIMAGHIGMLVFFSLIFIFSKNGESLVGGYGVAIPSVAFTIFLFFLELLVAAIQAYVFTLLTAIYIGMAVEEAHH